jgi:hypothetical protein
MEEALIWVGRIVKFIPVFRDLWDAVRDDDTAKLYAAQMEMTRKVREQQARETFALDDPDATNPGAQ